MSQIAVNTLRKHFGDILGKGQLQVPSVTLLYCNRMRNIITPRGVIRGDFKFMVELTINITDLYSFQKGTFKAPFGLGKGKALLFPLS